MGTRGLDFKHKEVVNITDGRRLRLCARCNSRLIKWHNGCKKENRYNRFKFERTRKKNGYVTKKNQKRTCHVISEKFIYDVVCEVEL